MTTFIEEVNTLLVKAIHGNAAPLLGDKAFNAFLKTPAVAEAREKLLNLVSERIIGEDLPESKLDDYKGVPIRRPLYDNIEANIKLEQQRTTLYEGTKEEAK